MKTPTSWVEPKRFLVRAQQAEGVLAVALEGEHHVDQVLEDARAGEQRPPW